MRSSPFLKPMDASEIEARFSNDSAIRYEDIVQSSVSYEEMKPFLSRLPPREVDLIELYYCEGKNQKDIAKIFGVTQGAVSSRLARAKKRLTFLRNLPKVSDVELDVALGAHFESLEIEIIKLMIQTTCQSETAKILNERHQLTDIKTRMTQVKVRHRFEKCRMFLEKAKEAQPELAKFHRLLDYVSDNLYKLHEVKLPHFDRGHCVVLSLTV